MISRKDALAFVREQIDNENVVKHMLATEAIMRTLARKLEPEKEEEYGLAGLLHDGDFKDDIPEKEQGIKVSQMLKEAGHEIPESVQHTMAAHNWRANGTEPKSKMDWSLFCCDTLTGLIIAVALVRPSKKLADVKLKSIRKKWKQPSFAAGTRREDIALCEEKLNIPLDDFISLGLTALQEINDDLGL